MRAHLPHTAQRSPVELLSDFILRSYWMVSDPECLHIQWTSDGSSFEIRDVEQFCSHDLRQYLPRFPARAFFDVLNICKIRKVQPPTNLYSHPFFQQNSAHLLPLLIEELFQGLLPRTSLETARAGILLGLCKRLDSTHRRVQTMRRELALLRSLAPIGR